MDIGAEAEVPGERMRVAEDALDRVAVVDAVGARHGVQQVDRFGAQAHGVGKIALETQLNQHHSMQDIADKQALKHYARLRKIDVTSMNLLTSGLDSWFGQQNKLVKNVSNWSFKRLNSFKMAKKLLIQQVAK